MSKREFLENLRLALNGRVSPGIVADNLNYYEDYINTEIRKGKSEEEVMAQLGDPRLIARTIVQTHGGDESGAGSFSSGSGGGSFAQSGGYFSGDGGFGQKESSGGEKRFRARIPGWMLLILLLVAVVLILSLVFQVVAFLLPILLPIFVVVFLVKFFRDWLN